MVVPYHRTNYYLASTNRAHSFYDSLPVNPDPSLTLPLVIYWFQEGVVNLGETSADVSSVGIVGVDEKYIETEEKTSTKARN